MEPLKIWEVEETVITKEKKIRRFTFRNLLQSFLDIFELDQGIVYTVIGLFKFPGKIIREHLDMDRLTITNPLRYFFFVVGVSAFLTIKYDFWIKQNMALNGAESASMSPEQQAFNQQFSEVYQSVFIDYLSLWFAVAVFFVALFSYLFFKKSGLTYWEQFIANLFIFNQMTLIFIPFILVSELFDNMSLYLIYLLLGYIYAIWAYRDLFGQSWGISIVKGFLVQILGSILFFGVFSIGLTLILVSKM
ncbi:hypothetical protein Aoki45_16670 [Algoriphagus sp. oki45]|uniref:DUF3667 domain-containing protein n=1 Tax=Algoriphagus sp. oki45 TaxID=3067294 RepID=UPI0027F8ACEB|nr:hypothetical protein Aoki45_16670 [Algoriphagus sp. oki45]